MPNDGNKLAPADKRWTGAGLAIHLAGFALGFIGEGLVLLGKLDISSGVAVLEPLGDLLYGLGLVLVVSIAARSGVSTKYLIMAGTVIGIGLFYKSAVHEIHMASGMGFGLPHVAHIGLGAILITISVIALSIMAIHSLRSKITQRMT